MNSYERVGEPDEKGSWQKIAFANDIRHGKPLVRVVQNEEIAFFRIGDEIHAITNVCPHQHAPVLAEGKLEGTHIECPMHGWKYDVTTGDSVEASGSLLRFETKIIGNDVFIFIPEEKDREQDWW